MVKTCVVENQICKFYNFILKSFWFELCVFFLSIYENDLGQARSIKCKQATPLLPFQKQKYGALVFVTPKACCNIRFISFCFYNLVRSMYPIFMYFELLSFGCWTKLYVHFGEIHDSFLTHSTYSYAHHRLIKIAAFLKLPKYTL